MSRFGTVKAAFTVLLHNNKQRKRLRYEDHIAHAPGGLSIGKMAAISAAISATLPSRSRLLRHLCRKNSERTIRCIDEGVEDFDPHTCEFADVVGITCITGTAPRVYEFSKILRARGMKVVLGGVHPTLCPDEAMQNADAVVTGYAEESWPQALRDVRAGKLQPIYKQSHMYQFASVPEPRRDLLKKSGYITMNTVQAVRGCPHKCNFCVVPKAWPQYLQRPIPEVIAEIEKLEGNTFLFLDLSPTEDRKYIMELWRQLIPLKKIWGGLSTIRLARDPEMLALASKSGCRGLLVGIESITPETIKQMDKGFNRPSEYIDAMKKFHDHGIAINGCFVFGLDGDTPDIFERTLEFVMKTGVDLPRFAVATPFPGTPLFHELDTARRLITKDWQFYDGQHVLFRPKNMSVEQLHEGVRWTWKHAYSIPSVVRRIVKSTASRNLTVFKTSVPANFGYTVYSKFLPGYMPVPCENSPWESSPTATSSQLETA
jgi:radical SAM superfamily enzyme YgiQ (UPF0313 family)